MDYEERQALIAEGVNPDDLRMQLRHAAVRYWLRRRAIEAGIRPRCLPREMRKAVLGNPGAARLDG